MVWNPEKFFAAIPIFRNVPPDDLRRFAWKSRRVTLNKGEFVFQEGEPAEAAWWVAEGFVKIARNTPQGRLVTMEMLVKGDVFAPAGIMPLKVYPASAVAVTKCAVVHVPGLELASLVQSHPVLPQAVLAEVSQRLQRSHNLRALDAASADKRVAAAILWLGEKTGPVIAVSRREISEIAGVAPETAIRVILDLSKRRWLAAAPRSIEISDRQALQSFVEQG